MYSLVKLNNPKIKIAHLVLEFMILERTSPSFNHCISLIVAPNSCRDTNSCLIVSWPPPYLYPKVPSSPEACKKYSELLSFSVFETSSSFFNMTPYIFPLGIHPILSPCVQKRMASPTSSRNEHMNLAWPKRMQHTLAKVTDWGVGTRP